MKLDTVYKNTAVIKAAYSMRLNNGVEIYQQKLLDVPQQPGFPETIIWPEKPLAK